MRAGGSLGEDTFALKYECLSFPCALGLARVGDGRVLPGYSGLRFLLFYRFAFQSL
jgi:hypothetical protein